MVHSFEVVIWQTLSSFTRVFIPLIIILKTSSFSHILGGQELMVLFEAGSGISDHVSSAFDTVSRVNWALAGVQSVERLGHIQVSLKKVETLSKLDIMLVQLLFLPPTLLRHLKVMLSVWIQLFSRFLIRRLEGLSTSHFGYLPRRNHVVLTLESLFCRSGWLSALSIINISGFSE
jgi:hypothetical protein